MGIIICPKCGEKIPDTSRKCKNCGWDGVASYLLNEPRRKDNIRRQQEINERDRRERERELQMTQQIISNNPPEPVCVPKCLICGSTNVKKISGVSRTASIGFWGIFSKKIGKQWHCNNCGSDF